MYLRTGGDEKIGMLVKDLRAQWKDSFQKLVRSSCLLCCPRPAHLRPEETCILMWQTKYWSFKSWLTFTRGSSNLIFSPDLSFLYCSHLQSMSEPLYFGTLRKMSNCEIRRGCPWYKRLLDLADVCFLLIFKQIADFINFNSIEDFLWVTFSCRKGRGRLLRKRGARPKTKPWDGRGMCCRMKGFDMNRLIFFYNVDICSASLRMPYQGLFNSCCPLGFLDGEEKKNYNRHYKRHQPDSDFKHIFHGQSTGRRELERTLQINESLNVW